MERGTGFFAGVAVGLAEVRTGFFVGLLVVVVVLVDMFAVVSKKMCSSTSSSSDGVDGFAQMWLKSARRWRRFQLFQVSNDRVALFRTLIDIDVAARIRRTSTSLHLIATCLSLS